MKYLKLLIIALIVSSCCSTKKVVKQTPKVETKEIAEVVKPEETEIEETPKSKVVELIENTTEEVEVIEEQITPQIPLPPKPSKEVKTATFNHNRWNILLQEHVSEAGNVNYQNLRKNRTDLDIYIDSLGEKMPTENWTKNEILAYWINAYNAFTIDLILRNYPIKSIKDIKDPWKQRLWKLGAKWYNLDEIEHQILRKMDEPRIHFAIVCASFSCPKLQNKAFTADNLEAQLSKATKDFLGDSNRNTISENSIKLSKIFKWFGKDFTKNGSLIDFLNTYSDISISNKAKKSFRDYNWDLND